MSCLQSTVFAVFRLATLFPHACCFIWFLPLPQPSPLPSNPLTAWQLTDLSTSVSMTLIGGLVGLQTVANLGTISAVNIKGAGSGDSWSAMTNTYGAAWEVTNQPAYPISLEVTSGSQTVSSSTPSCITALCIGLCFPSHSTAVQQAVVSCLSPWHTTHVPSSASCVFIPAPDSF